MVKLIMMTMMTTTTIIMHACEGRMELICTEVQDTKGRVPEKAPCYQEEWSGNVVPFVLNLGTTSR